MRSRNGIDVAGWRVFGLGVCVLAAGCAEEPFDRCDPCFTHAYVFGVVTDTADNPIDGAVVRVDGYVDAGCSVFRSSSNVPSTTQETGAYRAELISLYSPHAAACLVVMTDPVPDRGIAADTFHVDVSLDFVQRDAGLAYDSVKVDIKLE